MSVFFLSAAKTPLTGKVAFSCGGFQDDDESFEPDDKGRSWLPKVKEFGLEDDIKAG
jgi:hypothetical protein